MKFNQIPKKWIVMLSVCIVLFCYGFACVFGAMTYHTNDDVSIQDYICAFSFDGLWWVHPWISIFLSYPLGVLSYFIPQVSWWYVASQLFVAVSMLVIHYVALRMAQIKEVPLWLTLAFLAIFDSIFNIISIAEIAFTIVPIVISGCVISLAFYYPYVSEKKRKYIVAGGFIGIIIAISHRWESGTIGAAFVLLVIAMVLAEKYGLFSKKMVAWTIVFAAIIGGTILGIFYLNDTVNTVAQGEEWMQYSPARSSWIDYRHDTYEENPELYNAVGWTEDTYNLASNWIFLSDEITEEAFRYLADNSETNHNNISVLDNLKTSIQKMINDTRILFSFLVMAAVCGFVLVIKICQKDWKAVFFVSMDLLACATVLGYLMCFVGRVIFRSVFIILYPTILIAVFLFIGTYQKNDSQILKRIFTVGLIIVVGLWSCSFYKCTQILASKKTSYGRVAHEQLTLTTYQSQNRDKTFIYQGFAAITYKRVSPVPIENAYCMGGSLWRSNYMKHFQEINNIDQFNWTVFELPHVYFLGRINENTAMIVDYLQREHNCKGVAVVDLIDKNYGLCNMKFVYEDNLSDYESFFTVVDGSFIETGG